MNLQKLINEIGDDMDLLTKSDQWLDEERRTIAAQIDQKANELRTIQTAQRIKRALQQRNLVPLLSIIRTESGEIEDIVVRIMNLPDAIGILRAQQNDMLDDVLFAGQLVGWNGDGYDIQTSAQLRPSA